jgi:glycosyltransferase involved in cell wall biosynthesis
VEIVAVDNGSTEEEKFLLTTLGIRVIDAGFNRGYAGGINLGIESLGPKENYLVMNPDVEVLSGCLDLLWERLAAGASVAGPRLFLDRGKRFILPINEPRLSRWSEVWRRFAGKHWIGAWWARRLWRKAVSRSWLLNEPFATPDLCGAIFAFTREAWESVGRFDENYQLYFEETDWMYRAKKLGLSLVHEPRAEAIHFYNQSCQKQGLAGQWFQESEVRFGRRQYGRAFYAFLNHVVRPGSVPWPAGRTLQWPPVVPRFEGTYELFGRAQGYPAAVCCEAPMGMDWEFSEEFLENLSPGDYALRVVWPWGREGPVFLFRKP